MPVSNEQKENSQGPSRERNYLLEHEVMKIEIATSDAATCTGKVLTKNA